MSKPQAFADLLGGPAQLVLAATVARRYFLDGRTKIEIAEELQLSRFKVARLIEGARASGMVRIEISYPGALDIDLSARLRDQFGLEHAIVIDTPYEDEKSLRWELGRAAADLLSEIVTPADVLGLAWARSVSAMASQLQALPAIPVVQLTGALFRPASGQGSPDESSVDVVRDVARVSGGRAYLFFAPLVVANPATARALRRQPDVAQAFRQISSVTKAIVGIGGWAANQSTLYEEAADPERRRLARQGVCSDVGGVFLDDQGTAMATAMNERMVGINGRQLKRIPEVIGIPYGLPKTAAVLAAIRGGMVNSLVTHASLAAALIERDAGDRGPDDSPVPEQ